MTFKKLSFVLVMLLFFPFLCSASAINELKHSTQRFYIADDLDNEYQYHRPALTNTSKPQPAHSPTQSNNTSASDTPSAGSAETNEWPISEIALTCFLLAGFLAARKQSSH